MGLRSQGGEVEKTHALQRVIALCERLSGTLGDVSLVSHAPQGVCPPCSPPLSRADAAPAFFSRYEAPAAASSTQLRLRAAASLRSFAAAATECGGGGGPGGEAAVPLLAAMPPVPRRARAPMSGHKSRALSGGREGGKRRGAPRRHSRAAVRRAAMAAGRALSATPLRRSSSCESSMQHALSEASRSVLCALF